MQHRLNMNTVHRRRRTMRTIMFTPHCNLKQATTHSTLSRRAMRVIRYIKVETLDGSSTLFCKSGKVGTKVVMPFSVPAYTEYKITIVKTSAEDRFATLSIHSCETPG